MMKKQIASAFLLAAAATSASAGDFMMRARVIGILPDDSSSIPTLTVDSAVVPEVDFSYFFTKNLAAELILATAKHDVDLGGVNIGEVRIVPPTLTLQYHFMPDAAFRPYVGAGINYTFFTDRDLLGGAVKLESGSFGGALQAGFDYMIDKNWSINADVKYIWVKSDVIAGGATIGEVKIDPWVLGLGVGYRF